MARGRVHVFRMKGGRAITAAVIRRAQMRAAFDDLTGYLGCREAIDLPREAASNSCKGRGAFAFPKNLVESRTLTRAQTIELYKDQEKPILLFRICAVPSFVCIGG